MILEQQEMEEVAHGIDDFLYELAEETGMSTAAVSGMVLARLAKMCETTDELDNFYKLLNVVTTRRHEAGPTSLQ